MKIRSLKIAALAAIVAMSMAAVASADTIAAWNLTATQSAPVNTLGVTSGANSASASATELGMTLSTSFTFAGGEGPGCTANCDVNKPVTGDAEVGWRIRGNGNSTNSGLGVANGWNLAAPQYSQGVQFLADTTGYTGITVSYDWTCTNQGVADMQPQYTINGTNWINYSSGVDSGILVSPPGVWQKGLEMDLTGVSGVNGDPSFGIRLVSCYDPTAGTYIAHRGGPTTTVRATGVSTTSSSLARRLRFLSRRLSLCLPSRPLGSWPSASSPCKLIRPAHSK